MSEWNPEMHTAVRNVLKHHKLTTHGDGVVEADLIAAVLSAAPEAPSAQPMPEPVAYFGWRGYPNHDFAQVDKEEFDSLPDDKKLIGYSPDASALIKGYQNQLLEKFEQLSNAAALIAARDAHIATLEGGILSAAMEATEKKVVTDLRAEVARLTQESGLLRISYDTRCDDLKHCESALEERNQQVAALTAERDAAIKDAERFVGLVTEMLAVDIDGPVMAALESLAAKHEASNTLPFLSEIREAIDAALRGKEGAA